MPPASSNAMVAPKGVCECHRTYLIWVPVRSKYLSIPLHAGSSGLHPDAVETQPIDIMAASPPPVLVRVDSGISDTVEVKRQKFQRVYSHGSSSTTLAMDEMETPTLSPDSSSQAAKHQPGLPAETPAEAEEKVEEAPAEACRHVDFSN